jgi:hypothetical protein
MKVFFLICEAFFTFVFIYLYIITPFPAAFIPLIMYAVFALMFIHDALGMENHEKKI